MIASATGMLSVKMTMVFPSASGFRKASRIHISKALPSSRMMFSLWLQLSQKATCQSSEVRRFDGTSLNVTELSMAEISRESSACSRARIASTTSQHQRSDLSAGFGSLVPWTALFANPVTRHGGVANKQFIEPTAPQIRKH